MHILCFTATFVVVGLFISRRSQKSVTNWAFDVLKKAVSVDSFQHFFPCFLGMHGAFHWTLLLRHVPAEETAVVLVAAETRWEHVPWCVCVCVCACVCSGDDITHSMTWTWQQRQAERWGGELRRLCARLIHTRDLSNGKTLLLPILTICSWVILHECN